MKNVLDEEVRLDCQTEQLALSLERGPANHRLAGNDEGAGLKIFLLTHLLQEQPRGLLANAAGVEVDGRQGRFNHRGHECIAEAHHGNVVGTRRAGSHVGTAP